MWLNSQWQSREGIREKEGNYFLLIFDSEFM